MFDSLPWLGVGLGYAAALHDDIVASAAQIDFLEVNSDQFLYASPEKLGRLLALRDRFPLIPHGIGLSVGTAAPLNTDYLNRLAAFVTHVDGAWCSDHLGFTKVPETDVQQPMPLWFTEESLEAVCRNIRQLKSHISVPFLVENLGYEFPVPGSEMSESQFITRVLEEADIGLLLDVNVVMANSAVLGYDPYEFLRSIPAERVVQIHVLGGQVANDPGRRDAAAGRPAWELLGHAITHTPAKAILVEWEPGWLDYRQLLDDVRHARELTRP
jgi:uncharacterized protein